MAGGPLRVVFAGTPAFAARALEAIAAAGHSIPAVLTQPDRPAGRGMRLASSAVAQAAEKLGIDVMKPPSLKQGDAGSSLADLAADVMVVAAYGLILPPSILAIPRRGCLNIHASLLPRWRGAAPIQRAILAGDTRTGITIMQMDAGLDTGAVLLEKVLEIGPRDTTGSLTAALAELGARAIVETLSRIDELTPTSQDEAGATYASKVTRADARIDWGRSALEIDRQVRAFNPVPGSETSFAGAPLKVWRAEPAAGTGTPGESIEAGDDRLVISCATGALSLLEVQRPGGKRLAICDFLRGMHGVKT